MEDITKEQLDLHSEFVSKLEDINNKGRQEMEEFLKFLTKKIQTEKSKTTQLEGFYNFKTLSLDDSPFSTIIDVMKRKMK